VRIVVAVAEVSAVVAVEASAVAVVQTDRIGRVPAG
jgi:hypothetical protein